MVNLTQLLGFTGSPAAILAICVSVGWWLDKDAEDDWKNRIRQALKAGSWFSFYKTFINLFDEILDRAFGSRLFTWRGFWVSMVITVIATAGMIIVSLLLLTYLYTLGPKYTTSEIVGIQRAFAHFNMDRLEPPYLISAENARALFLQALKSWTGDFVLGSSKRLPVSLVLDYVTLLRVRLLCRRASTLKSGISSIAVSIIFDFVTLTLVALFGTLWASCIMSGPGSRFDSYTMSCDRHFTALISAIFYIQWHAIVDFRTQVIYGPYFVVDSLLFSINVLASILPALVFYLYIASTAILHLGERILHPLTSLSRHLKFRNPFTLIASVVGVILASLLSGFMLLLHHLP